jgi:hypothetical protein
VVLLGLPGAGKTSLATLLVGAAAQHHGELPEPHTSEPGCECPDTKIMGIVALDWPAEPVRSAEVCKCAMQLPAVDVEAHSRPVGCKA